MNPGETIIIQIDGAFFVTRIDENGTQRFLVNRLIRHLVDSGAVDLNRLCSDYQLGLFTKDEYLKFCMGLGYSVGMLAGIFPDLEIVNPLWKKD